MTESSITLTRCARVLADMTEPPDTVRFRNLQREQRELNESKRIYPELEMEIQAGIRDEWDRHLERSLERNGVSREAYAAYLLTVERQHAEAG